MGCAGDVTTAQRFGGIQAVGCMQAAGELKAIVQSRKQACGWIHAAGWDQAVGYFGGIQASGDEKKQSNSRWGKAAEFGRILYKTVGWEESRWFLGEAVDGGKKAEDLIAFWRGMHADSNRCCQ